MQTHISSQVVHFKGVPVQPNTEYFVFIDKAYSPSHNLMMDKVFSVVFGTMADEDNSLEVDNISKKVIDALQRIVFLPYEARQILREEPERFYQVSMFELTDIFALITNEIIESLDFNRGFLHYTGHKDDQGMIYRYYNLDDEFFHELDASKLMNFVSSLMEYEEDASVYQEGRRESHSKVPEFSCLYRYGHYTNPNRNYQANGRMGGVDAKAILKLVLKEKRLTYNLLQKIPILKISSNQTWNTCITHYHLCCVDNNGKEVGPEIPISPHQLALYLTLLDHPEGIKTSDLTCKRNNRLRDYYELLQANGEEADMSNPNQKSGFGTEPRKVKESTNRLIAKSLNGQNPDLLPLYLIQHDYQDFYFVLLPDCYCDRTDDKIKL